MHSEDVEAGGLMSYGVNFTDLFRRAGDYVDKILRGAKPAEIPVEQGFVLTAVGQNSLPLSIAIRSLRQNASSCSRRAIASALPSSKVIIVFCIVPPTMSVSEPVTRSFEPALAKERFRRLNLCVSPCRICGARFLYSEMVRKHIANEHNETMPPSMYE
jgi:ABC transporter substrate binding protein